MGTDVPIRTDEKKEESNLDIDEKKGNSKSDDGLEELLSSMGDVLKAAPWQFYHWGHGNRVNTKLGRVSSCYFDCVRNNADKQTYNSGVGQLLGGKGIRAPTARGDFRTKKIRFITTVTGGESISWRKMSVGRPQVSAGIAVRKRLLFTDRKAVSRRKIFSGAGNGLENQSRRIVTIKRAERVDGQVIQNKNTKVKRNIRMVYCHRVGRKMGPKHPYYFSEVKKKRKLSP